MLIARRNALSESFEPCSGRDYGGVSVIHLQPRPTATASFHIKEDGERGGEEGEKEEEGHVGGSCSPRVFFFLS